MIKRVSIDDVNKAMDNEQHQHVLDIRDPQSFAAGHIEKSINVNNANISEVLGTIEDDEPIIVVCYHGHSSLGAAQYILNLGYSDVASMDGGFEGWKQKYTFSSTKSE
ncbi:MAG: thiosulfate sulfurtransferase GlpE [Pseudomonadota bacterium]